MTLVCLFVAGSHHYSMQVPNSTTCVLSSSNCCASAYLSTSDRTLFLQ